MYKRETLILQVCADLYLLGGYQVLCGPDRTKNIRRARELAVRLLRLEGYTTTHIAKILNRTHSTIIYLLKKDVTPSMLKNIHAIRSKVDYLEGLDY